MTRRRYVALLWVAVLVAVGWAFLKAPGASDEKFSMPGIESPKAFDLIEQRFPGATADGATARVVFVAPDGQKVTASANKAAIEKAVDELAGGSQVANTADPFESDAVSKDGSTAYVTVTYKVPSSDVTDASRESVEKATEQARDAGLTVEAGGDALDNTGLSGVAEIIGISVAAVVLLLLTFGSLAGAGLPLLTATLGVGISFGSITALADALGLSTNTGTLAMMLGLAVGIDYALFVVSRYREERARGREPQEAAGLAVGTAGSAVTGVLDWSDAGQGDALFDLATLTLGHQEHLGDVVAGYGTGVDLDVVRAWWSLRSLQAVRWLVEHGFDPFAPGCEIDVLRSQL
ncbi:MMPL family transporter [Spirillospora sp. CA-128828]|uniref:MMPL family transporter n=1 Tax=Spirillospora sp. CA-128828 TaxID=3240033 RepID=UPI003D8AC03D